jgi:flagellin-specific chaperone FliS
MLNIDAGGDAAQRLETLYVSFRHHLGEARSDQDADNVVDVARMLHALRSSWAQIAGS